MDSDNSKLKTQIKDLIEELKSEELEDKVEMLSESMIEDNQGGEILNEEKRSRR